jgi:hypothetical protein
MDFKQYVATHNDIYKCERQGCKSMENYVPCLECANTFYCSVVCRNLDISSHKTICAITNTRDMLLINSYVCDKLKDTLSSFATTSNRLGAGVINIRSYNSIWDISAEKPVSVFISYTLLSDWHGHVPTVVNNDFNNKMIVNIHFEDMNKPQLHRLNILACDTETNSRVCVTI